MMIMEILRITSKQCQPARKEPAILRDSEGKLLGFITPYSSRSLFSSNDFPSRGMFFFVVFCDFHSSEIWSFFF